MKRLIYFLLLFAGACLSLPAQSTESRSYFEASLSIVGSAYGGDLRSESVFFLDQAGFGIGAGLRYHFGGNFAVRGELLRSLLRAADVKDIPKRQERGFSFETELTELSVRFEWYPFGHRHYQAGFFRPGWSPYLFVGGGGALINVQSDFVGEASAAIRADQNNEEKALPVVPIGLGMRVDVNEKTALGFEYGYRLTQSDYLDGFSLAANPDHNDRYGIASIQIWRQLGRSDRDNDGIADSQDACPDRKGGRATGGCPDLDQDGVADHQDLCPDVAGAIALSGCPDADNDGITDLQDHCPDLAGSPATHGCPDQDGDSVADKDDECPQLAGVPGLGGCPDTDADGIIDNKDLCPDQPGTDFLSGCPDTDGDGIGDSEDRCPDQRGLGIYEGCPDTDADGLPDLDDDCPSSFGLKADGGCPQIETADLEILQDASRNIRFEGGSDRIQSSSLSILNEVAKILLRYPNFKVSVEGHTDNVGNELANEVLSRKRAKIVHDQLIARGIDPDRLSFNGYGGLRPIASNQTSVGRRRNRRVVLVLSPGS